MSKARGLGGTIVICSMLVTRWAAAVPGQEAPYVIAEIPYQPGEGGTGAISTELNLYVCYPGPGPTPSLCPVLPTLVFLVQPDSVRTIIWTDATTAGFSEIVGQMTDGVLEPIETSFKIGPLPLPETGGGGHVSPETHFFTDQAGPSGVDLFGYTIDRVGLRVDAVIFDTNPNGTFFHLTASLLFEGTITSKESCKNGGWQTLHGPDGRTFRNQGDCIQFVNTGK